MNERAHAHTRMQELHVPARTVRVIRRNLLEMLKIIFSTSSLFVLLSFSFSRYPPPPICLYLCLSRSHVFTHSLPIESPALWRRIVDGFVQSTAITYPTVALWWLRYKWTVWQIKARNEKTACLVNVNVFKSARDPSSFRHLQCTRCKIPCI